MNFVRPSGEESTGIHQSYSNLGAMLDELSLFIELGGTSQDETEDQTDNDESYTSESEEESEEESKEESELVTQLCQTRINEAKRWDVLIQAGRGSYNFDLKHGKYCYYDLDEMLEDKQTINFPRYADSDSLSRDVKILQKFFSRYNKSKDEKIDIEYLIVSNGGLPSLVMHVSHTFIIPCLSLYPYEDEFFTSDAIKYRLQYYCGLTAAIFFSSLGMLPFMLYFISVSSANPSTDVNLFI